MKKEYIVYCDESIKNGPYYSNFYGGAVVSSSDYDEVVKILNNKKAELNLFNEVKWTKVTAIYLDKYIEFINCYFDLIEAGIIKIRIMFRNNRYTAQSLTEYQELNGFYLLYYQFLKNAFGFPYANGFTEDTVILKTYFDKLPNTKEQNDLFKEYIFRLQHIPEFEIGHVTIRKEDITDVDSKKHGVLQGMDIILGSIQFKLNKENLKKPEGARTRAKRTIAKEKLYKVINGRIQKIYPHFNIGISTAFADDRTKLWTQPYRHWSFIPQSYTGERKEF